MKAGEYVVTQISLTIDCITADTPAMPEARRGTVAAGPLRETAEQLANNLVWWPCAFCGRYVMVDCSRRGRDRCTCGAVQCWCKGDCGWRKNGEESWFI